MYEYLHGPALSIRILCNDLQALLMEQINPAKSFTHGVPGSPSNHRCLWYQLFAWRSSRGWKIWISWIALPVVGVDAGCTSGAAAVSTAGFVLLNSWGRAGEEPRYWSGGGSWRYASTLTAGARSLVFLEHCWCFCCWYFNYGASRWGFLSFRCWSNWNSFVIFVYWFRQIVDSTVSIINCHWFVVKSALATVASVAPAWGVWISTEVTSFWSFTVVFKTVPG